MIVVTVSEHHKNTNWRNVTLLDDKGAAVKAICFGKEADSLVAGKPLPEGWTTEEGQYGPVLRYPKAQGGGSARMQTQWRNTEEGQKYEQVRMDRRTALMQAVASGVTPGDLLQMADQMYAWLRKE